jgi:hypothetical protein
MDHGYRQQTPGYSEYATGAINDLAPTPLDAASMLPGLGEAADTASLLSSLSEGELRDALLSLFALGIPGVGAGIIKAASEPIKKVKGYRAHRIFQNPKSPKHGGLFPAMIGKDTPLETALQQRIPLGEWLKSEYIPFKMAPRQGWHAGTYPYGRQFNKSSRAKQGAGMQPDDVIYTEVDIGADQDFSDYLDPSKETKIYMGRDVPFESPEKLPEGGFYVYKNKPSDEPWLIGDYARHNRIITDEEVRDIMRKMGLEPPPPRYGGDITEAKLRSWGLL